MELGCGNVRSDGMGSKADRCMGCTCESICAEVLHGSVLKLWQMLFEVLVIISILLNALDRPHHADIPLTKALYRDGIIYFIVSISMCVYYPLGR